MATGHRRLGFSPCALLMITLLLPPRQEVLWSGVFVCMLVSRLVRSLVTFVVILEKYKSDSTGNSSAAVADK